MLLIGSHYRKPSCALQGTKLAAPAGAMIHTSSIWCTCCCRCTGLGLSHKLSHTLKSNLKKSIESQHVEGLHDNPERHCEQVQTASVHCRAPSWQHRQVLYSIFKFKLPHPLLLQLRPPLGGSLVECRCSTCLVAWQHAGCRCPPAPWAS